MIRAALVLTIVFTAAVAATQTTSAVAPFQLTTITGSDPQDGGQPLTNLYNMDQGSGVSDDWNKFMSFQAIYVGYFSFHIPEEAKSGLTGITINSNVMASAYPYQQYKFSVKNQSTGSFVYAGDSEGALEWQWSPVTVNFNQNSMSDFYDASSVVVVQFELAITTYDVYGYMDYMSVNFSYDETASSTETSSTDTASTTADDSSSTTTTESSSSDTASETTSSTTDDSSATTTTESSSTGDSNDITESTATETAQVAPYSLLTITGTDPTSGQPLSNLNVHDQGGDAADAWGKFIQFKAYYVGYFDFYVATEARDALSGITLHTNVQASRHPYQTFNFYLYNHATGAFDWIGDNDDSTDWVWFAFSLDYSSDSMSNYVDSSHSIRVKFELAKDDYDAYGNMDFIAMSFHHSGTGPVSTIVANAVQVTTGDVVTHATCYNADGSFIRADGACRLNIADLNSDFAGSVQNGAWNPESNKLMFTTFKDGYNVGYPYIRVFDLLTGETENFGGHLIGVNMPGSTNSWSPDNMLLYAADINYGDEMYCHDYNDKTGTQILLTKTGTDAWEPSFSADGKWAIFEGGADKILYLTDTTEWHADKEYTQLTSSTRESRQPVWSANGKYITYQAKDSGASDDSFQVMVIDVPDVVTRDAMRYDSATFSERVLTDYGTDCSFSPAGDWIVYSGNHHQGAIDAVYVVPVAGGDYVRVTEHDGYDGAPGWSPDGCYIVTESSEYAPGSPPEGVTSRTDLYIIKVPTEVAELTCNVDSSSSDDGGVSTGGTNSASEGSTNSASSSSSSSNNAGAIVGWFSFGTVSGIILTSLAFVVAILVVKFVRRPRTHVATDDDIEAGASAPKSRKMRKGAAQLANDDNADWDDEAE